VGGHFMASLTSWFLHRVPAFGSLRNYSLINARSDLIAGVTVATVAVPQAMAYAVLAGLPPAFGLYTAIVMTTVGALFDSSRQLINGPTNVISVAVGAAIAGFATEQDRLQAAILMAFLVGAIQLAITLLRLGDLTRYISHSVVVGFTLGAGSLLFFDQIRNLFAWKQRGDVHDQFLVRLWHTWSNADTPHLTTTLIGLGSIALVLLMRWGKQKVKWPLFPELITVVAVMAVLTAWLGLDQQGVAVIGAVPTSLPPFSVPNLDPSFISELAPSAFAIATLGLLEAIAMAKGIASITKQRLDVGQQCLSEGFANMAGSFFSCFPGSGSLTRSAINQQAGAASQWSGVVSAAAVAVTVLVFAPWARFIPKAALAGILIVTSIRMVDWKALRFHLKATVFDRVIVVATALSAVAISVEFCVLIGVFLSFALAVPRAGRMRVTEFVVGRDDGLIRERLPEDEVDARVLIFGLEGELFFGANTSLEKHLDSILTRFTPDTRFLVLRVKRLHSPDAVGLHQLFDAISSFCDRGVNVVLCGVRPDLAEALERTELIEQLGRDAIFLEQPVRLTSTLKAIQHAYQMIGTSPSKRPLHYAV
jgi:sulfate permease, SulP family